MTDIIHWKLKCPLNDDGYGKTIAKRIIFTKSGKKKTATTITFTCGHSYESEE